MIILASNSPRRKEILESLGIEFTIIPADINENIDKLGEELVMELAYNKAMRVFEDHSDDTIIGADTIVYMNNHIYGKPKDYNDCCQTLRELSNHTHRVITGVAIINKNRKEVFYDEALVTFKELTEEEISQYANTQEPYDKAGGYAIQGQAQKFIEKYEGDFYTIVGLPRKKVEKVLQIVLED